MGPRSQFEWTLVRLSASDSGSAEHLLWGRHVLGPVDTLVNSHGPHFRAAYGLGKGDRQREGVQDPIVSAEGALGGAKGSGKTFQGCH